jgi:HK97 gp10 family phage protein
MAFVKSYNRIPQIVATLEPKLRTALRLGAEGIARDAQGRVHVDSGDLRNSIHVEEGDGGFYVVGGDDDVFYGIFEEFGTTHSPAHPFLVPALEAGRDNVVGLVAGALRSL